MTAHWPVTLRHGDVSLRPLRVSDAHRWREIRMANNDWLAEWEATSPLPSVDRPPTFRQSALRMRKDARAGRSLPFVVEYKGAFVGQLNVSDIVYGALRAAHFGYWIDEEYSGRGIMTTAVALVTDHLLFDLKLHRVEVAIRPENVPSNRLIHRLGFEYEGTRKSYLHINNQWRDHHIYVLLREDVIAPLVSQLPD